jgi:hypothetical protein
VGFVVETGIAAEFLWVLQFLLQIIMPSTG